MKILVIKTSSLGDIIHTLPAITDVTQHFPNATIDWVVEENFAEIPQMHFAIHKVIPMAWRRWRKQLFSASKKGQLKKFFRELRQENYDFIIDAQGLIKSAVIAKFARGLTCGYDFSSARESFASCFYHKKAKVSDQLHAVTKIRGLFAKTLNYQQGFSNPDFGLRITEYSPYASQLYLVFVHGTAGDYKLWPVEYWQQLLQWVAQRGYQVLLPWGNSTEQERAQKIASENPQAIVLPKSDLKTLAGILKNAKAVVAVDTGPGHLAAALDVPTFSLYGPTDPALIGSFGKNVIHIYCEKNVGKTSMADLSVNQVTTELSKVL